MPDAADTLYRQTILEHAHHPRNAGRVERPDLAGQAANPLCGDELQVTLALVPGAEGQRIGEIRGQVRGCVISQAACSLMTEAVRGRTLAEAAALGQAFAAVLEERSPGLPLELAALQPLVEVRRHRSRIGCALLPWQALAAAKPPGSGPA